MTLSFVGNGKEHVLKNRCPLGRRLWGIALAVTMAAAGSAATSPDLAVSAADVSYDSGAGHLSVTVHVRGAERLLPIRVVASDEAKRVGNAEAVIEKMDGGVGRCYLPWPRVAPNARIRIEVSTKAKEADRANKAVVVTMDRALRNKSEALAGMLRAAKQGRLNLGVARTVEAEDFAVRKNVRVEKVPGASGGKAVRLLDKHSRIETTVSLGVGAYAFFVTAMGVSPSEDAVHFGLDRDRRRLVLRWNEWSLVPCYGFTVLTKGPHRLAVTFAEPNVLVDRILIVRQGEAQAQQGRPVK